MTCIIIEVMGFYFKYGLSIRLTPMEMGPYCINEKGVDYRRMIKCISALISMHVLQLYVPFLRWCKCEQQKKKI